MNRYVFILIGLAIVFIAAFTLENAFARILLIIIGVAIISESANIAKKIADRSNK